MTACELAHELLRRIRQPDLDGAVALFDPNAELFAPSSLCASPQGAVADFCRCLVELLPAQARLLINVAGDDTHAAIALRLDTAAEAPSSELPLATIVIDVDVSRIRRARLLADQPSGRLQLLQTASDTHEDATRDRYLGRRGQRKGGHNLG